MNHADVKARFEREGIAISEWARSKGFPPSAVYRVLGGYEKGMRGQAHRIAVELGLKAKPTGKINA